MIIRGRMVDLVENHSITVVVFDLGSLSPL